VSTLLFLSEHILISSLAAHRAGIKSESNPTIDWI
jgi:hypothetical protein